MGEEYKARDLKRNRMSPAARSTRRFQTPPALHPGSPGRLRLQPPERRHPRHRSFPRRPPRAQVIAYSSRIAGALASATGDVYAREKEKRFLVAGRGAKLNIRATPTAVRAIETPGLKSKTIAAANGATTLAYTGGQQTVRLKR